MSNKNRKAKSDARLFKKIIFDVLLRKGEITTKGDTLSDNQMEDKVYTKRISINKPYKNGMRIIYVSVTSDNNDFNDASIGKIRINTKNVYDQWVNIFINEAPYDMVDTILDAITEKVEANTISHE